MLGLLSAKKGRGDSWRSHGQPCPGVLQLPVHKFKMSGETVLHEHLWGRSPFVCPVRGRREHKEQIVASTRAVYPGSGRGGRVKPYSCLVCIALESSGA